jgi:mRNA interferase YafQ
MKPVRRSGKFSKDLRLAERQGRDLRKLYAALDLLTAGRPLPVAYRDHGLKGGKWRGCRDCHIEPDWVLIYRIEANEVVLVRIGSHSDLFG